MIASQDVHDSQEIESAHRERWIVWIVSACVFMSVVNTSMVNVALPTIGDQFDANEASVGWLVTIYSLTFGIGTPFYGRLGDRYGLRRMFVIGLCVFVAASVLAGVAANFGLLIAFRALQAAGSAAVPSLGMAMVARAVPFERRGRALGLTAMAVGAGSALGPTLGGALTQFTSWRMVFLVSALLIVLIPLSLRYLPIGEAETDGSVDWFGGITLAAAIAGIMLAVTGVQRQGPTSTLVLVSAGVAVFAALLTIWRQKVAAIPFIAPSLVRNRRYLLLCLIGFCMMAGNIGALVITPFLFRDINGLSAGQIGLAMLPAAVAVAVLSRPVGRLADRTDPFLLIVAGMVVTLVALVLMATLGIGWTAPAFALLAMFVGVGQALISAPLSVTLTASVPQRVYGVGLGLYNMTFFIGSGFGAALATAMLASRRAATDSLLPIYAGSAEFVEFSDAFIPSIMLFGIALGATVLARRTPPPISESAPHTVP